jgi:putative ABC transport system permease protein
MEILRKDVRYAVRTLGRSPGFSAVAVVALALGIGANTAIFSVVNAVMLRPLPYRGADRLVVPATVFLRLNTDRGSVSYPDFLDWKSQNQLFDSVAAYGMATVDMTGGEEPERILGAQVSEDYFRVMGAPPLLGRMFLPEENLPGAARVLVLSYGLWMRRFGGDPKAIGGQIELAGLPYTVVGVMPKDSMWPSEVDAWAALGFGPTPPQWVMRRDNHVWRAVARLRPGVTVQQAQAVLTVMARQVEREAVNRTGTSWKLHPLSRWIVGPQMRETLVVLLGAVGLVLLIACVNVANLLVARGAGRERELAIRAALGAGRSRLVRQLLTESVLLSLAGGLVGLLLGLWGVRGLVHFAPAEIPRLGEVTLDSIVLGFTLALSLVTALAFGLLPAVQAAWSNPVESFRDGGRTASGGVRSRRLRSLLVVSELALTIVLLVGAGLLIRSFMGLQQVNPGFPPQKLITMQVGLPGSRYRGGPQVSAAFEQMVEGIRHIPGVVSCSAVSALPVGGGWNYLGRVFLREGQPEPPADKDTAAQWNVVQPGYFHTLGIPVIQGRDFTDRDVEGSTPVIIITQGMARQMFPNQSPLGRRIRSWRDENLYREIIGVVGEVRYFSLTDPPPNLVYVPHRQNAWRTMILTARTLGEPHGLLQPMRREIRSRDQKLAVAGVKTMEEVLEQALARPRFSMFLLTIFAGVAMILAAVGIYGVMSYAVTQRTHEIGIRMALGAQAADVLREVLGQGLIITALGVLAGLAGAAALTRVMAGLLFGVTARDPATFLGVSLFLAAVAVLACYLPARRAMNTDPIVALRYQ